MLYYCIYSSVLLFLNNQYSITCRYALNNLNIQIIHIFSNNNRYLADSRSSKIGNNHVTIDTPITITKIFLLNCITTSMATPSNVGPFENYQDNDACKIILITLYLHHHIFIFIAIIIAIKFGNL